MDYEQKIKDEVRRELGRVIMSPEYIGFVRRMIGQEPDKPKKVRKKKDEKTGELF